MSLYPEGSSCGDPIHIWVYSGRAELVLKKASPDVPRPRATAGAFRLLEEIQISFSATEDWFESCIGLLGGSTPYVDK